MEDFLRVLENEVQIVVLLLFATMYVIRMVWLMSLPVAKDLARAKGPTAQSIILSFGSVLLPSTVENKVRNLVVYLEFALFHLAVAVAIAATFIYPYAPGLLISPVRYAFLGLLALGCLSGLSRLAKRGLRPEMRRISTPDDYFSLGILTLYLGSGALALLTVTTWALIAFFVMTTFFLLYVPWSKISHYLYIAFARFFFGFYFGRRGVLVKGNQWRITRG